MTSSSLRCSVENMSHSKTDIVDVNMRLPLHVVEWMAKECKFEGPRDACKAVLKARRSLYEQWQEDRRLPWIDKDEDVENRNAASPNAVNDRKLIAAAPLLLDVLLCRIESSGTGGYHDEREAIRAALPDDVAAEVLK